MAAWAKKGIRRKDGKQLLLIMKTIWSMIYIYRYNLYHNTNGIYWLTDTKTILKMELKYIDTRHLWTGIILFFFLLLKAFNLRSKETKWFVKGTFLNSSRNLDSILSVLITVKSFSISTNHLCFQNLFLSHSSADINPAYSSRKTSKNQFKMCWKPSMFIFEPLSMNSTKVLA